MSDASSSFELSEEEMPTIGPVPRLGPMLHHDVEEDEMPDLGDISDEQEQPAAAKADVTGISHRVDTQGLPDTMYTPAASPTPAALPMHLQPTPRASCPLVIPVVNSATVDPDTYDLDRLMNPKAQKRAMAYSPGRGERSGKRKRQAGEPNFIRMNIESTVHPQSSHEDRQRLRIPVMDPVNVEERFYKYRDSVNAKVRRMGEEQAARLDACCTFSPKILSKRGVSESPRSADEFYHEMLAHKEQIQTKVQKMRDRKTSAEKQAEKSLYMPKICEKSKVMAQARSAGSISTHEKLYQAHRDWMQRQVKVMEAEVEDSPESEVTQDSVKPFTPSINKASQRIVREKPIEDSLLEDAKRRQKKRAEVPNSPRVKVQPSNSSILLLVRKFKSELAAAWTAVSEGDVLTYTKTAELLKVMHFIENDSERTEYEHERSQVSSLWRIMRLADEGGVTKLNLETFLLAVMNYPLTEQRPHKAKSEEPEQTSPKTQPQIGWMEDGVLRLSLSDSKQIRALFQSWYEHRVAFTNKSSKNPTFKDLVVFSHRPKLNKTTKILGKKAMEQIREQGYTKHHEYLLADMANRSKRQQELDEKVKRVVYSECTFTPKLLKRYWGVMGKDVSGEIEETPSATVGLAGDYSRLLTSSSERRTRTSFLFAHADSTRKHKILKRKELDESELERNTLNCTFSPDTSQSLGYESHMYTLTYDCPRGMEKAVERMLHARREAESLRARRETGLPTRGNSMVDVCGEVADGPMVVLAVQVNGRAEELCVRPGENISILIRAFVQRRKLSTDEAQAIEEQLRSQYLLAVDRSSLLPPSLPLASRPNALRSTAALQFPQGE